MTLWSYPLNLIGSVYCVKVVVFPFIWVIRLSPQLLRPHMRRNATNQLPSQFYYLASLLRFHYCQHLLPRSRNESTSMTYDHSWPQCVYCLDEWWYSILEVINDWILSNPAWAVKSRCGCIQKKNERTCVLLSFWSAVYISVVLGCVVTYCEWCTIIQLIDRLRDIYAVAVMVMMMVAVVIVVVSIRCESLLWYRKSDCRQCECCYCYDWCNC